MLLGAATASALPPPPPPPPPSFGPIDMTQPGATYTATDGTIWTNLNPLSTTQPAGTGVYQPFLREHDAQNPGGPDGIEYGLSTDAAGVLDNVGGGDQWTHSVLMGTLGVVKVGGIDYFSFTLDLNEPSGGGKNYLSLDQLKIWTTANSAGGSLTSVAGVIGAAGSTLRYDLDGTTDQTVWLDYDNSNTKSNSGSGEDDMEVLIPTSYFAGYNANDYMYFYAVFGSAGAYNPENLNPDPQWEAQDGFEEWRVHTGDNGGGGGGGGGSAPEPMSMFLFGGGALGLLAANRKK